MAKNTLEHFLQCNFLKPIVKMGHALSYPTVGET